MAKLLSGTRIYGTATVDTQLFVSGSNVASSTITGALQVVGGVGIGGNLFVGGTIYGTVTTSTNIASGTAGQVPYQTGAGATSFYGPGTAGQILLSSGTNAPVYTSTSSIHIGRAALADLATTALTATTSTNLSGGANGSLPYQSATGTTSMLAIGTNGYVLSSNGTTPQWSSLASIGAGSATTATNVVIANETATSTVQYLTFISVSTGSSVLKVAATTGLTYLPNSGYVGMGIATPTAPLHLVSSANSIVKFQGGTTGSVGVLYSDATQLRFGDSSGFVGFTALTVSSEATIRTNSTEAVRVDSSQQVGINTTRPNYRLDVRGQTYIGAASTLAQLILGDTTNATSATISTVNSDLIFSANGTAEALRITSSKGIAFGGSTNYGSSGQVLQSAGNASPIWVNASVLSSGTATNIANGTAGQLVYQSAASTTGFVGPGTAGQILLSSGTNAPVYTSTSSIHIGRAALADLATIATTALTATTATNLSSGAAGSLPYQTGAGVTTMLALGTSGYVLTAGASAPTWSAISGLSAGNATNLLGGSTGQIPYQTGANTTGFSANLSWNSGTNTLTTTGTVQATTVTSLVINRTGGISAASWTTTSPIFNNAAATLTDNSTAASGTVGTRVAVSLAAPTYGATNSITITNAVNLFVDAPAASGSVTPTNSWAIYTGGNSYIGGSERVITSLAVGTYSVTANTGDILASGNGYFGTSTQLNTGFTNKLTVGGSIVAGTAASTNGTILLQGYYGTGSITNLGTEYSSGGPVLSYGVYPSNAAAATFFSSSGVALTRAAYTQNGNTHQWYTGASQTVAIGGAVTMTNPMSLNATGLQALSLGVGTPASGTTGEIRATNEITAYYSSDARLKENVRAIDSPIEKIEKLRGVYFDWTAEVIEKRGGEDGYFVRKEDVGVIAQEVEAILPEVVAERNDGYLAVKYEKLVPLLIEAIKEQQKQIAQLSDMVNKLANK